MVYAERGQNDALRLKIIWFFFKMEGTLIICFFEKSQSLK